MNPLRAQNREGDTVEDPIPSISHDLQLRKVIPEASVEISERPLSDRDSLSKVELAKSVKQPDSVTLKRSNAVFLEGSIEQTSPDLTSKRYRPESVSQYVSQWVEASGSVSYKRKYSQSENPPRVFDSDYIRRRRARSTPGLEYMRDPHELTVPPIPASIESSWTAQSVELLDASRSVSDADTSSEYAFYRIHNLFMNKIHLRDCREQFPNHIACLVDYLRRDRDSPGPSLDQLTHDAELHELEIRGDKSQVRKYFEANVFPRPGGIDVLRMDWRLKMKSHTVPSTGSKLKVYTPVPDMLYGYDLYKAFPQQKIQIVSMECNAQANVRYLLYPFLTIEVTCDGPGESGSLWAATNRCLGGASSCVKVAESLNTHLRRCHSDEAQQINSAAFSIAMNGTEARLYVSWKHNGTDYYTQKVESFLLQKPIDFLEFRKFVLNIIDWGKGKRLEEIQDCLSSLEKASGKNSL